MKGPASLLEHEDNWPTRMGLSFGGHRVVYRGKDLFNELNELSWMELFLFGITGRRFSADEIRIFEGIWVLGSSYPDPRIWNNRIASLAGTARSTPTLGLSGALSLSEANVYGRRPDIRAIDFLLRTGKRVRSGESLDDIVIEEMKRFRVIPGYGRPIVNGDERIIPGIRLAKQHGYFDAEHFQLALQVEEVLQRRRYRMKMNAAALGAAMAADIGLTPREYYLFLTPCFIAGILPCYIEAADRQEGVFLPLACASIDYLGRERRSWN